MSARSAFLSEKTGDSGKQEGSTDSGVAAGGRNAGGATDPSGGFFAVFAMTLDEDLPMTNPDVRDIDPDYTGYNAAICLTPGGSPHMYLYSLDQRGSVPPAVVPFSILEKSDDKEKLI